MKVLLLAFCATCALAGAGGRERPLMRDFIGSNVKAAQLKHEGNASVTHILRSHPEDPATKWLENLRRLQKWRAEHAPTKELWETEFGYDTSARPAAPGGESSGITEEQQAMWTVRSFLLLAGHGADRAHLISTNDADEPRAHGSGGGARNSQPKPVFHALAWLRRSLGDYRFSRVEREDAGDCYCYEFIHGTDAKKFVWAIWKPAGDPRVVRLFHDPLRIVRAERMPLAQGGKNVAEVRQEIEGYFAVEATERPVLVWLDEK